MRDRIAGFDITNQDGIIVASVEGEIDGSNAGELRLALSDRLPSSSRALVLDLSRVKYLDSSGIELLFELGRRLAARRQSMRLVVPERAPTRRVLELCAIGSVAPVHGALEEAIGELNVRGD